MLRYPLMCPVLYDIIAIERRKIMNRLRQSSTPPWDLRRHCYSASIHCSVLALDRSAPREFRSTTLQFCLRSGSEQISFMNIIHRLIVFLWLRVLTFFPSSRCYSLPMGVVFNRKPDPPIQIVTLQCSSEPIPSTIRTPNRYAGAC